MSHVPLLIGNHPETLPPENCSPDQRSILNLRVESGSGVAPKHLSALLQNGIPDSCVWQPRHARWKNRDRQKLFCAAGGNPSQVRQIHQRSAIIGSPREGG
jgi:hypothetical protein